METPDEGLAFDRWLSEAVSALEATMPEAQGAFVYYERLGDGMGMIRALEVVFNLHTGGGRFTDAVAVLDRANGAGGRDRPTRVRRQVLCRGRRGSFPIARCRFRRRSLGANATSSWSPTTARPRAEVLLVLGSWRR